MCEIFYFLVGDTHTKREIFNDSGVQIRRMLTLRASVETSTRKSPAVQIGRSRRPVHIASARDDHVRKLLVQNIHRSVWCVACSAILFKLELSSSRETRLDNSSQN